MEKEMIEIEFDEKRHQYKVDGAVYPSVTEILEHITAIGLSKIPPYILDEAKERGTYIHEVTQDIDLGMPPEEIADSDIGYITAYLTFIDEYAPVWEYIEHQFYEPKNGFAGTIDRVGDIDGQRCVLDIKTASSPSAEQKIAVCCQTSAYAVGIGESDCRRYALYLHPDGTYELFDCEEYEAGKDFNGWFLFRKLLEIHVLMSDIKKKRYRKAKEEF